jgi:hypothetical protein
MQPARTANPTSLIIAALFGFIGRQQGHVTALLRQAVTNRMTVELEMVAVTTLDFSGTNQHKPFTLGFKIVPDPYWLSEFALFVLAVDYDGDMNELRAIIGASLATRGYGFTEVEEQLYGAPNTNVAYPGFRCVINGAQGADWDAYRHMLSTGSVGVA